MHWRRKWQPTPVFLPGESQGQGSLMGCRLWGRTELDTTEATLQQQQQQKHKWGDYRLSVPLSGQTLWISITHSKAIKILFLCLCFMFVDFQKMFHLNIWWVFILEHRVLRIFWEYPVTSHFASLWGLRPLLEIHTHLPSPLVSASPNWLLLIFSGSTCVWLVLFLLLWVTWLSSVLLWGCAGCLCLMSWCLTNFVFFFKNVHTHHTTSFLFLYSFIFGCAGSSLLCTAFL